MQLLGKQRLGATDQAFTGCRAGGHAHATEADHFPQQYNQGVFVQLTDPRVAARCALRHNRQAPCEIRLETQRSIELHMRQPQVAGQLVRADVEADKLPRRSVRRTAALNLPWVIQGDGPWPGRELLAVQPHFLLTYKV